MSGSSVSKPVVGSPSSTLARSTHVVALLVAALRVGTLVQMVPSAVVAVHTSPRPSWAVATWSAAIAMSLATAARCVVRRRPPGGAWALADVTVAVAVLLLGVVTVPPEHRLGSWVGFQPGYALSVAFALAGVRRPLPCLVAVGALGSAQAVYLAPLFVSHGVDVAAAAGNLLTVLVLPAVIWAGAGAVLGLARTADENRALAVAASREAEARRGRVAVHNAASTIRLLLDLDRPMSDPARAARAQLLVQASDELSRMRRYLRHADPDLVPGATEARAASLATLVEDVAREFADLDVVVQTDLARDVVAHPSVRGDLAAALRSLLLNVREHAGADQVVLHAAAVEPPGSWALSVHDDGAGFDVDRVRWGAGLADVVVGQLGSHGIDVEVDSLPGRGTTVTVRCLARDEARQVARRA
jgi:signal transduction histidine kinase